LQIKKITENKIRIALDMQDLKEKNIDIHSFMSNSIESQNLFCEILNKAEKEIGFKTKDYKLIIEALAIPNRELYINCNSYY
jgi:negative regulator of genetic competence, sporulation and motility